MNTLVWLLALGFVGLVVLHHTTGVTYNPIQVPPGYAVDILTGKLVLAPGMYTPGLFGASNNSTPADTVQPLPPSIPPRLVAIKY